MNPSASSPHTERQSPSAVWITLGFAAVMTIVAILQRSFPHPFNLTLIGALGLWGAARLRPSLGLAGRGTGPVPPFTPALLLRKKEPFFPRLRVRDGIEAVRERGLRCLSSE